MIFKRDKDSEKLTFHKTADTDKLPEIFCGLISTIMANIPCLKIHSEEK